MAKETRLWRWAVITIFLACIQPSAQVANATCFLRNGDVAPNTSPCNPSADVSHCCESGKHICMSNNLCLDIGVNHFIEGACSDQTWQSGACPQYCRNNSGLSLWGDVRQCDNSNSEWVCGQDPSNCENSFSVPSGFVDDGRVAAQSAFLRLPSAYATIATGSSQASTTAVTTSTSVGAIATQSSTSTASTSSTSNGGTSAMTAGLGAGLGVGLPLLIALATSLFFLARAKKQIRQLKQSQNLAQSETTMTSKSNQYDRKHDTIYSEAPTYRPQHELDSGRGKLVEAPSHM